MAHNFRARKNARDRKYYAKKRKQVRARQYFKRYGITIEQRDALFKQQGSVCKICGTDTPSRRRYWATDHCHTTGKIRGILCDGCNLALGLVNDSIEILRNMISYLESN